MRTFTGIAVSPGVAVAEAFILARDDGRAPERPLGDRDPVAEIALYEAAVAAVAGEIRTRIAELRETVGPDVIQILESHILLVEDPSVRRDVGRTIGKARVRAETAVSHVYRAKADVLRKVSDAYLAGRVKDIRDVERRLVRELMGEPGAALQHLTRQVILIAYDLSPTETAGLALLDGKIRGIVTEVGGATSHTAIIARDHGLPALVGVEGAGGAVATGELCILDGAAGTLIVDPDAATVEAARARETEARRRGRATRQRLRKLPSETPDGHRIHLLANIDAPADIESALRFGADGVGLFRTEFLVRDGEVPDEEAQFAVYKAAAEQLGDRPLTLRTFDFGADKLTPGRRRGAEANPFLGFRSIRYCLGHLKLFKAQLRAMLRASHYGHVRLMFPMVSAVEELRRARLVLQDVQKELRRAKVPFDTDMPVGIMIEVPSAAVVADMLAEHVAFFSIGTNDLVGYTLAVDRGNPRVASLYRAAHPAVLRLLRQVIAVGVRHKVEVGMCGEMCADPLYTTLLLGLGLREMSLAPALLPEVKRMVRRIPMREAEAVAARAATFTEASESESYLAEKLRRMSAEE